MEPSPKFEAEKGTTFVVEGEQITILRQDQPAWKGPLSDILDFVVHVQEEGQ
jgi:hypothetical protein